MKHKIGVAALLGLLAVSTMATHAFSACNPLLPCTGGPCPILIQFDANCYSYETSYNRTGYNSAVGSMLTIVGTVSAFGPPLNILNVSDPSKEYTFVMSGLTSAGTVPGSNGPTLLYDTDYSGGTFTIYEGSPRDAPSTTSQWSANCPGSAGIPAKFNDGTPKLTGVLCGFHVSISKTGAFPATGSFRANYRFTNPNAPNPPPAGNLFNSVGEGEGVLGGVWCVTSGCTLCPGNTGYSAHPNGKFDASPTTAVHRSTWGTIKSLYR